MWEGLQGAVAAAEMLHRAGYPAYEWSDRAILRSIEWLHNTTFEDGKNYPATGDDVWQIYIINKRYGKNFPAGSSSTVSSGKMMGFTDWTHSSTSGPTPEPEPVAEVVAEPEPTPEPAKVQEPLKSRRSHRPVLLDAPPAEVLPSPAFYVVSDGYHERAVYL